MNEIKLLALGTNCKASICHAASTILYDNIGYSIILFHMLESSVDHYQKGLAHVKLHNYPAAIQAFE
jgi:hypothetical protein